MIKLLKSDMKLLRWSKVLRVSLTIALLIIISNFSSLRAVVLGVTGSDYPVGTGFGFLFKQLSMVPTFNEIVISSLANTLYFWIIVLMLVTAYITKDTIEKRQITYIANGTTVFKLLVSKLIVASLYLSILYIVTIGSSLVINMGILSNVSMKIDLSIIFKSFSLNLLAMNAFMWLCSLICVLAKGSQYAHITSFIIFFAGGFNHLMAVAKGIDNSLIIRLISGANPFVYTMYFSALNFSKFKFELLLFTLLTIVITILTMKFYIARLDYT